ncbi:hypothetical protein B0H13DRAFT_1007602 [Mycena leptocephala]|nr:hypothetical protein B0H13DRAFT_1007602 [Mycena leptocephala]
MYSAKLGGGSGRITVAMYQGDGAEEAWRRHMAKYESIEIRHPNIMQLYGIVCAGALRAMVFHDELIPFKQFLKRFVHLPIFTAGILGCCAIEFWESLDYFYSVVPTEKRGDTDFTFWIRPATYQFCIDLVLSSDPDLDHHLPSFWFDGTRPRMEDVSLSDPNAEAVIISNLSEYEYHDIFSRPPLARERGFTCSAELRVGSGMIFFHSNSQSGALFKIAELPGGPPGLSGWTTEPEQEEGTVMDGLWTRYKSRRVRCLQLQLHHHHWMDYWLAQANHILTRLDATSRFEDYFFVYTVVFRLQCLPNKYNDHQPNGYLFVCPPKLFETGQDSLQWPDYPAYWSLDPSGASPLSTEDAKILGFPIIHYETVIDGYSWNRSVYDALRRFHQDKGFNPESQELAIHLSYPLYKLSSQADTPSACTETIYITRY